MSSIYHCYGFGSLEEKRVIDNNQMISEKLEKIKQELERGDQGESEDGFTLGLDARRVEDILAEEQQEELAATVEETAEQIIEKAQVEAERIIAIAEENAKAVKANADKERMWIIQSSSKEGFDKGYAEAQKQCQSEYEAKMQELQMMQMQMEEEVRQQKEEMEPVLVETILELFSHMTHLLLEDKKDVILPVVNSAFEDIDISKNYLIKVCHEDAVFLKENKDKIISSVADAEIEIIEDPLLKKGQCMIDTDFGVFDCGLDQQLEKLTEDIKILSCAGRRQA